MCNFMLFTKKFGTANFSGCLKHEVKPIYSIWRVSAPVLDLHQSALFLSMGSMAEMLQHASAVPASRKGLQGGEKGGREQNWVG